MKIIIGIQGALLLILIVLWIKSMIGKSKKTKEADFYKHKAIAAEALVKQLSEIVDKSGDTTSDVIGKLIDGFLRSNGQEPTTRRTNHGAVAQTNESPRDGQPNSKTVENLKRDGIEPHRKEDGQAPDISR